MNLDAFEEPIRRFLLGTGPFPADVSVVITVCSDKNSQHYLKRRRAFRPRSSPFPSFASAYIS